MGTGFFRYQHTESKQEYKRFTRKYYEIHKIQPILTADCASTVRIMCITLWAGAELMILTRKQRNTCILDYLHTIQVCDLQHLCFTLELFCTHK